MKGEMIIKYEWKNKENRDAEIRSEHLEALREDAEMFIKEDLALGRESGFLGTGVRVDDQDGEEGIEYIGTWEFK